MNSVSIGYWWSCIFDPQNKDCMKEVFSIRQFGVLLLGMLVCSSSCSFIKTHFSRQRQRVGLETFTERDIPSLVPPQKKLSRKDSLRHWFVAVSKEKPIRIRNKHNRCFGREQDFRVIPLASVSNMLPSHSQQIVHDDVPTRSGGFGIAGFVMSFFAWISVIGIIAIIFSAIGLGKG